MALGPFPVLYLCLVPKYFIIPEENPTPATQLLLTSFPQPLATTTIMTFSFYAFTQSAYVIQIEPHNNVTFCAWLLSMGKMFFKFMRILACISISFLPLWLHNIPLHRTTTICLSSHPLLEMFSPPSGSYEHCCCETSYTSIRLNSCFQFFGYLPRSRIAESCGDSTCNLLRNPVFKKPGRLMSERGKLLAPRSHEAVDIDRFPIVILTHSLLQVSHTNHSRPFLTHSDWLRMDSWSSSAQSTSSFLPLPRSQKQTFSNFRLFCWHDGHFEF